jgi:hypothetical protein
MTTGWLRRIAGHVWTVLPACIDMLWQPRLAGGMPLQARINDRWLGKS